MPHIVKGDSVCLSSPTASGKTEAVVAPLFQRYISFRRDRLSVVYVAPTKALVNDIYSRLQDYLASRIPDSISRYTGDHHDFKSPDGLFLLVTTPEALDSLQLTRPEMLASIRAVVIDEIHLLHGTPRGQQLRYVLQRLKASCIRPRIAKDVFQIVGMTATIDGLEGVAKLWVGENCRTITVGDPRKIEMTLIDVPGDSLGNSAQVLANWIKENQPRKVLAFANSRNTTHTLAAELHSLLYGERWPVHLHIGILSGSERDRVEGAMKNDPYGVCVATATLEVGIDIGDVDVIALAEPTYSIASYLQRIGRGNRKSDVCRVVALCGNQEHRDIYYALHHCACNGIIDDHHEYDRPSVRFQQILSLAWQGLRSGKPLTLENISVRSGGFHHRDVVEGMLDSGAIRSISGNLVPNDALMDEGDCRRIHSIILDSGKIPMIDAMTGDVAAFTDGSTTAGRLFMGGSLKKLVTTASGDTHLEPLHKGEGLPLSRLPSIRGRGGLSRKVVWAMAELKGMNPRQWLRDGVNLITWGGLTYNRFLVTILKQRGLVFGKPTITGLSIEGINEHTEINPEIVAQWINTAWRSKQIPIREMSHFCQGSKYMNQLTPELQNLERLNSVPYEGFIVWLGECEPEIIACQSGVEH
jgi:ATP-dependent helicase Lhr and Lhr-like helicase